jgi:hypothetical protein
MAKKAQKKPQSRRQRKNGPTEGVVGLTTTASLFPSRRRGHMFYDTTFTMSCTANTVTSTVLRANSVFDPDLTGTGTTVAGYAQMAALYGRYRVVGIKAILSFQNYSTGPGFVFVAANNLNTVGTNFAEICAQRHIWKQGLGGSTGYSRLEHTLSFPIHKIYGVPKTQVMNEDDFAGLVGGHPNNPIYLHTGFSCGATATTLMINVRLEYDVVWSIPVNMAY